MSEFSVRIITDRREALEAWDAHVKQASHLMLCYRYGVSLSTSGEAMNRMLMTSRVGLATELTSRTGFVVEVRHTASDTRVGLLCAHWDRDWDWMEIDLLVQHLWHGRGIARMLLAAAEQEARLRNFYELIAHTDHQSHPAAKIVLCKAGFAFDTDHAIWKKVIAYSEEEDSIDAEPCN